MICGTIYDHLHIPFAEETHYSISGHSTFKHNNIHIYQMNRVYERQHKSNPVVSKYLYSCIPFTMETLQITSCDCLCIHILTLYSES